MLDSILVSLIRSFTEFIAVGSSGHTILLREVFRIDAAPGTELAVRAGMIVSVLASYHRDLWAMVRSIVSVVRHPLGLAGSLQSDVPLREAAFLAAGTIPAAVLGVWYGQELASWATDLKLVSTFVILGGLLLFLSRLFRRLQPKPLSLVHAILMGLGQALAIIPGLPRMSASFSFGVYGGMAPQAAARFSVLLALPALLGVLVVGIWEGVLMPGSAVEGLTLVLAFVASAAAGWLGIRVVLGAVRTGAIRYIAFYCLLIGLLGIIFL